VKRFLLNDDDDDDDGDGDDDDDDGGDDDDDAPAIHDNAEPYLIQSCEALPPR
jgi:hypothetical protein